MTRSILLTLCCSAALLGQPLVETGELNGAKYRIDVPENWNGGLVLYCHGYSATPMDPDQPAQNELMRVFLEQGFATARSGYAAGGWAIAEAVLDTEALRRLFISKHGRPTQTFVTGHSMGGFLTMTLMERFPDVYDGGLPMCGPLASALWFMERRVFDLRVVFDYYFPDALPSPVKTPEDYRNNPDETARVLRAIQAAPERAAAARHWAGLRTDEDLAQTAAFWTFILMDLQQRSGGNPFDNRDTIYEGSPDDDALNDGVRRYAADPGAERFLRANYEPSGRLAAPMLHLHTTYDPLVPPWVPNRYADLAAAAGAEDLFVQQYVKRPGHCRFEPGEVAAAFDQLRAWVDSAARPSAGAAEPAP